MRRVIKAKELRTDGTVECARWLIGKYLLRQRADAEPDARLITEVEAYDGECDLACHARAGRTQRTTPLYAEGGIWYVYLCYGIHEMLNLVVGPRDCLRTQKLLLRNTNWLGDEPFARAASGGLRIWARIRSSQPPQPATLIAETDGTATVVLEDGEDGVAVGQACVFYASDDNGARLLGGGFIARTARHAGTMAPELSRAALGK